MRREIIKVGQRVEIVPEATAALVFGPTASASEKKKKKKARETLVIPPKKRRRASAAKGPALARETIKMFKGLKDQSNQ